MIPDVRNLKPGTLLRCTKSIKYYVHASNGYIERYIQIGQIVMFLEFKIKKSYDPLMIYPSGVQSLKLKILADEGTHWIRVSFHPATQKLPKDLMDTNFACPLFDVASSS